MKKPWIVAYAVNHTTYSYARGAAACTAVNKPVHSASRRISYPFVTTHSACTAAALGPWRCVEKHCVHVLKPCICMSFLQPRMQAVTSMLSRTFCETKLREHRAGVLLDRERSMLPATQPYVEHKRLILKAQNRLRQAYISRDLAAEHVVQADITFRRLRLSGPRAGGEEEDDEYEHRDDGQPRTRGSLKQVVHPCVTDGCRGFLKRTQLGTGGRHPTLTCGVCDATTCSECLSLVLGPSHVCDPQMLASVQSISKDTRPCPKCGARIFRVSGCSQMFCTAPGCHTAFDWVTGVQVSELK